MSMGDESLKVYVDRLYHHAEQIFKLGFDEKMECSALTYSKRLYDRTEYVRQQMLDLGMTVRYDAVGNLFGLLKGKTDQKILITSHVDSVFNAGRYDGVLGIILPIELIRYLKDNSIELEHSLEILVCMGEESPGVTATFGSKLVTGHYSFDELKSMPLAYDQSTSVVTAINRYFREFNQQADFNLSQQELEQIQLDPKAYKVALEIHIEQFLLLQNLAKKDNNQPYIGIMRGVGGHIRQNLYLEDKAFTSGKSKAIVLPVKLIFSGKPSHSGATPMEKTYRNDALVKASQFILRLFKSELIRNGKVSFSNFEILHPALTSVPYEVVVELSFAPEVINEFKAFVKDFPLDVDIVWNSELKERVSSKLVYAMAMIVNSVHHSAVYADVKDEVRGTVTRLFFEAPGKAQCFCDVRGASVSGMEKVVDQIPELDISDWIELKVDVISKKKPAIFSEAITRQVEEVLGKKFSNRIMKGSISVPGQDIGVLSSHGIPSSLLFIESGTGHHPNEYVREEAMFQAFEAVQALVIYWDNNL